MENSRVIVPGGFIRKIQEIRTMVDTRKKCVVHDVPPEYRPVYLNHVIPINKPIRVKTSDQIEVDHVINFVCDHGWKFSKEEPDSDGEILLHPNQEITKTNNPTYFYSVSYDSAQFYQWVLENKKDDQNSINKDFDHPELYIKNISNYFYRIIKEDAESDVYSIMDIVNRYDKKWKPLENFSQASVVLESYVKRYDTVWEIKSNIDGSYTCHIQDIECKKGVTKSVAIAKTILKSLNKHEWLHFVKEYYE